MGEDLFEKYLSENNLNIGDLSFQLNYYGIRGVVDRFIYWLEEKDYLKT